MRDHAVGGSARDSYFELACHSGDRTWSELNNAWELVVSEVKSKAVVYLLQ